MQKISVLLSSLSGETKAFFVSSSTKRLHRKPLGNSKVFVYGMLSFKNEAQTNNKNFRCQKSEKSVSFEHLQKRTENPSVIFVEPFKIRTCSMYMYLHVDNNSK